MQVHGHQHLRPDRHRQLSVPRIHRSTLGSRIFCRLEFNDRWFARPSCWHRSLSAGLQNTRHYGAL